MSNILLVIPARMASNRLPGKPLLEAGGKAMVHHVYDNCLAAYYPYDVIVASCDNEILEYCQKHDIHCIGTSSCCRNGTERAYEAATARNASNVGSRCDKVLIVQCDEPELRYSEIDEVCVLMDDYNCVTAIGPEIEKTYDYKDDLNVVKAYVSSIGPYNTAMIRHFSRNLSRFSKTKYHLHLGIYGYSIDLLETYSNLSQHPLEISCGLEQLRLSARGYSYAAAVLDNARPGINTQEEYLQWKNAACAYTEGAKLAQ